jgi:beta-glucosidase
MRKLTLAIYSVAFVVLLFSCSKQEGDNNKGPAMSTGDMDPRVSELLGKMSLEEKIGQMTQVNLNVILKGGYGSKDASIDPALLDTAVLKYRVGSILNAVPGALPLTKWHSLIKEIQDAAMKTPNKIPVLYGIDAIHGVTFTQESTLFPHNIAEAASRNVELVKAGAKVTAKETRASGIRWNFDPVLDIARQPLWSRFPETFGEDPYLIAQMGTATIKGYEEDGLDKITSVASCMKHFIGYSNLASGKDRTPAYISEIQLREYYLPQFRAAVAAGASTVMINSGEINGVPVHSSKYLLTDVLRGELGFKGVIVTDWEDIIRLHTRHKIATTPKEAVRIGIEAGIDMSMIPHDYSFYVYLLQLVKEGTISEKRIDESVARILNLKFKTGLFDNPYPEEEAKKNFGLPEYKVLALEAAREAITLLKNDSVKGTPVLPLAKSTKVLIAGPAASSVTALNGCWSYSWQGDEAGRYPASYKNVIQSISDKIGEKKVVSISEPFYKKGEKYDAAGLTAKAKGVDYIILCLGENAYAETPGTIFDLTLDKNQLELAKAAIATGKPVILVLLEGRPRIIREIVPGMKAVVQAYWPGSQGGAALADILFGDYNPNGKLPYSYPAYSGMVMAYDYKFSEVEEELIPGVFTLTGYRPQWAFGTGLSYTKFNYSNLKLNKDTLVGEEKLTVTVDVQNAGARDGKVTVELYTKDLYASITPSQRRLRRFTKIELKAGESKPVTFELTKEDLAFVGADLKTVTEEGTFELMIEDQKAGFYYKK